MHEHHHEHGFGGGWGWGGGPYRREGFPLLGGLGMGLGSGLSGGGILDSLLAGGLGYMAGRRSQGAGQYQQYPPQYQQGGPQYQPYPPQYQQGGPQYQPYPPQYQQSAPQYQQTTPQYQAPSPQGAAASDQNSTLAQLKLLGHLHESAMLTDDEFQREKQKILNGS